MKRIFSLVVILIYLSSFGLTFTSFQTSGSQEIVSVSEKKGCSDHENLKTTNNTNCDKFYEKDKNLSCPEKEKIKTKKFSIENKLSYKKTFSFLSKFQNNDPPFEFKKFNNNILFTNLFGVVVSLE